MCCPFGAAHPANSGNSGLVEDPNDQFPARLHIVIERITIPGDYKAAIRDQLAQLAINEKSMFPELDRAARYIKASMTPAAILSKSGATI